MPSLFIIIIVRQHPNQQKVMMKSRIRNIKQLRGGDIFFCRVCVLQLVREPKDHLQPDCPGPHIDQVATIHELPNYNRSRLLYP
jgi:hypothetical protein